MSYLNKMYGRTQTIGTSADSTKSPSRVTGGLKAQGVDHFDIIAEDGSVQKISSYKYVQSLESQIKKYRETLNLLERKVSRVENSVNQMGIIIKNSVRES